MGRKRTWLRSLAIFTSAGILTAVAAVGGWAVYLQATGNIHEVEKGLVFRSNQLAPDQMATLLRTKHIQTVINLRGGSTGDDWYRVEVATVHAAGATLIDIPLSDSQEPDPELIRQLVGALASVPEPLLIHCKAGADRSGLAAALFELLVAKRPAWVAAGQLSFAYGHFPWLGSPSVAMDRTFWRVANRPFDYVPSNKLRATVNRNSLNS